MDETLLVFVSYHHLNFQQMILKNSKFHLSLFCTNPHSLHLGLFEIFTFGLTLQPPPQIEPSQAMSMSSLRSHKWKNADTFSFNLLHMIMSRETLSLTPQNREKSQYGTINFFFPIRRKTEKFNLRDTTNFSNLNIRKLPVLHNVQASSLAPSIARSEFIIYNINIA